jgi:hypothetical protein
MSETDVGIVLEFMTTTASGTNDMLETIGTGSVGGDDGGVGDVEVLVVDEGCSSCWAVGVTVGRGGRGLSQGCLKDSVEVMRFLLSQNIFFNKLDQPLCL